MAFSLFGIFAVLLELVRPLLPFLIALLVLDTILLILALRRGTLVSSAVVRLAVLIGAIAAVATVFLAPAFTLSSFANLSGALDYLSLVGGALAVGTVIALLSWPGLALLQRK